jgi:hypothetical protein
MENKDSKNKTNVGGLNKWVYADLAAQYSQQKGQEHYVKAAIDEFRKLDLDIKGSDSTPLTDWFATEEATQTLISIYSNAYGKEISNSNLSGLFEFYKPALGEANSGQKKAFQEEFNKYGDKNFADIVDEVIDAQTVLKKSKSTDEDKVKAQKVMIKYQGIIELKTKLEEYTLAGVKQKIEYNGLEKVLTAGKEEKK